MGVDGYRERAASSTGTVRSQVELARIWVESVEDGNSTGTAALVGLEEVERDASRAASSFERFQPPSELVGLRSEFSVLATESTDVLADIRIAAADGDWDGVSELAQPLPRLADRLEQFEERAEP